ncbi:MAG: hypothetical protein UU65_C0006G0001, partial [candidate division CPR2 bacterium GW2011_GWC1_41_48]
IEKVAVTDNHIILILDFKKILEEEAIQNIASEAEKMEVKGKKKAK